MLLASIATTALIFSSCEACIDAKAAWWCALLFAFEPFNVVNSTTMTNDVILRVPDVCRARPCFSSRIDLPTTAQQRRRFSGAAALMLAAFLVKITYGLPVLCVMAGYSLLAVWRAPGAALRGMPRSTACCWWA